MAAKKKKKVLRDSKGRFKSAKKKSKPAKKGKPAKKKKSKPAPKKKAAKKKKKRVSKRKPFSLKRPKVPVYHIMTGDPRGYEEDIKIKGDRYMNNSNMNRKDPSAKVDEIFVNTFLRHLQKSPFDTDEVFIYRHGISIRPRQGFFNSLIEEKISDIISAVPNSSIHHVDEDTTFSLRINFGSIESGNTAAEVQEAFRRQKDILGDVYLAMAEEYGDLEWMVFFDTEVELYE